MIESRQEGGNVQLKDTRPHSDQNPFTLPPSDLPISELQNSCCGCAGRQLHPSTTSSIPALSKRSTQSPKLKLELRSSDPAMTTLNTSGPVKSDRRASQVSRWWSRDGREGSETSSAELKGSCGWKRFHKFRGDL